MVIIATSCWDTDGHSRVHKLNSLANSLQSLGGCFHGLAGSIAKLDQCTVHGRLWTVIVENVANWFHHLRPAGQVTNAQRFPFCFARLAVKT